jgi:hypothetical protein
VSVAGWEIGFILDRRWHWQRGEMETDKKSELVMLARLLVDIPYALIGGLAMQLYQDEPRTTLDIDVALGHSDLLPRDALRAAGFHETGRFAHSENWLGPGGTPVQFTDDPAIAEGVSRAATLEIEGVQVKVLGRADLLQAKLRAAGDPARRRSKRLVDIADALELLEQEPGLRAGLTGAQAALLARVP